MKVLTLEDWRNIVIIATPLLAMVGWFYRQNRVTKKNRRERQQEEKLKRLSEQISEFYAPISSLRLQCKKAHKQYFPRMPKEKDNSNRIAEDDVGIKHNKIHDYIVDDFLIPINRKISNILVNKAHLIEEEDYPESFEALLDHFAEFEIVHSLRTKHNVSIRMEQGTFPSGFDDDINNKLIELKKKYYKLLDIKNKTND